MDQIGFAERLAYVRWLLNRGRTEPVKDGELAEWLGVHPKWLAKWKSRADAPPGRAEALSIGESIQPWGASVDWLYDGKGDPPEPVLWKAWLAGPDSPTKPAPKVRDIPVQAMERVTSKKPAARKRANDR